jgi:hypothetical protein
MTYDTIRPLKCLDRLLSRRRSLTGLAAERNAILCLCVKGKCRPLKPQPLCGRNSKISEFEPRSEFGIAPSVR